MADSKRTLQITNKLFLGSTGNNTLSGTTNTINVSVSNIQVLDITPTQINTNSVYGISGINVLSSDTLGNGVTISNLQLVGLMNNLSVTGPIVTRTIDASVTGFINNLSVNSLMITGALISPSLGTTVTSITTTLTTLGSSSANLSSSITNNSIATGTSTTNLSSSITNNSIDVGTTTTSLGVTVTTLGSSSANLSSSITNNSIATGTSTTNISSSITNNSIATGTSTTNLSTSISNNSIATGTSTTNLSSSITNNSINVGTTTTSLGVTVTNLGSSYTNLSLNKLEISALTLPANFVSSSLTSLGNLSSLTVIGNLGVTGTGRVSSGLTVNGMLGVTNAGSSPFIDSIIGNSTSAVDSGQFQIACFKGSNTNATDVITSSIGAIYTQNVGNVNGAINFHRGGAGTDGFISFGTSGNQERMRIHAGGNVSIGNATDSGFKLDVTGTSRLTGILTMGGHLKLGDFSLTDSTNDVRFTIENTVDANIHFGGAHQFRTMANSHYCTISSAGIRFGDNAAASYPIDVVGRINTSTVVSTGNGSAAAPAHTFTNSTSSGMYYFQDSSTTTGFSSNGATAILIGSTFYSNSSSVNVAVAVGACTNFTGPVTTQRAFNGASAQSWTFVNAKYTQTTADNYCPMVITSANTANTNAVTSPQAILTLGRTGYSGAVNPQAMVFSLNKYAGGGTANSDVRMDINADCSSGTAGDSVRTIMSMQSNGFVGIGTTAPAYTLDIAGSGRFSNRLYIDGSIGNGNPVFTAYNTSLTNASFTYIEIGKNSSSFNNGQLIYNHASDGSTANRFTFGLSGVNPLHIFGTGNVVIGANSPTDAGFKLDVTGTIRLTNVLYISDYANTSTYAIQQRSTDGTIRPKFTGVGVDTYLYGDSIFFHNNSNGQLGFNMTSSGLSLGHGDTAALYLINAAPTTGDGKYSFSSAGENNSNYLYLGVQGATNCQKVGIITQHLSSWGRGNMHLCTNDNTNDNSTAQNITTAHARVTILSGGNVGINNTAPSYTLDVSGTGRFTDTITSTKSGVAFQGQTTSRICLGDGNKGMAYSSTAAPWASSKPSDGIVLYGWSDGALGTINGGQKTTLYWNDSQQVGINNSAPAYTLDVSGTGKFSSTLQISGGNSSNSFTNKALTFAWSTTNDHRHCISTRHASGQVANNAIDFSIWTNADASSALGSKLMMTVEGNGVGIGGVSLPAHTLDVLGTIRANANANAQRTTGSFGSPALRVRGGDNAIIDFGTNSAYTYIQAGDMVGVSLGYHLHLNPIGGNVGINVANNAAPAHTLDVNGSARIPSLALNTGVTALSILSQGLISTPGIPMSISLGATNQRGYVINENTHGDTMQAWATNQTNVTSNPAGQPLPALEKGAIGTGSHIHTYNGAGYGSTNSFPWQLFYFVDTTLSFVLDFDHYHTSMPFELYIRWGGSGENNGYRVRLTTNGNTCVFDYNGAVVTPTTGGTISMGGSVWNKIRLIVVNGNVTLNINGTNAGTWTDASFGSRSLPCTHGFNFYGGAYFSGFFGDQYVRAVTLLPTNTQPTTVPGTFTSHLDTVIRPTLEVNGNGRFTGRLDVNHGLFVNTTKIGYQGAIQVRATEETLDAITVYPRAEGTFTGNHINFMNQAGTGLRGYITSSSDTTVQYTSVSDRRLKTGITSIVNSLDIIRALDPVNFRWLKQTSENWSQVLINTTNIVTRPKLLEFSTGTTSIVTGTTTVMEEIDIGTTRVITGVSMYIIDTGTTRCDFGFIAQDVFSVIPEMRQCIDGCDCVPGESDNCNTEHEYPINTNGTPKYYGLDYGKFTPYLTAGIKELDNNVVDMGVTIANQQSTIMSLGTTLATMMILLGITG